MRFFCSFSWENKHDHRFFYLSVTRINIAFNFYTPHFFYTFQLLTGIFFLKTFRFNFGVRVNCEWKKAPKTCQICTLFSQSPCEWRRTFFTSCRLCGVEFDSTGKSQPPPTAEMFIYLTPLPSPKNRPRSSSAIWHLSFPTAHKLPRPSSRASETTWPYSNLQPRGSPASVNICSERTRRQIKSQHLYDLWSQWCDIDKRWPGSYLNWLEELSGTFDHNHLEQRDDTAWLTRTEMCYLCFRGPLHPPSVSFCL